MKTLYLITLLLIGLLTAAIAQPQATHYGENSGTEGYRGSYFGRGAGAALTVPDPTGYLKTDNTFVGDYAGSSTNAAGNTAVGSRSLFSNTSGTDNVAMGWHSLYNSTTGRSNTALGTFALYNSTTGNMNTAVGGSSLNALTTGTYNSAFGVSSLSASTTASYNTGIGFDALSATTTGVFNSALGSLALDENVTGSANTAVGWASGPSNGLTSLSNATALGYMAKNTASNQVRIGNANVSVIGGRVGWSTLSDGRFKKEIKEDVAGLEFINLLRPVSYVVDDQALGKFLGASDSLAKFVSNGVNQKRETGFIAQEVEELVRKSGFVFDGIDAPQNQYDHYSIKYAEFVIPLVKAVQELTTQLQSQQAEIATLKQQAVIAGDKNSSAARTNAVSSLSQNVPNPFTHETDIHVSLPEDARTASIIIYALDGKQVKSIPIQEHGEVSVKISGGELKAGMYIYSLIVNGVLADSKRMVMMGN